MVYREIESKGKRSDGLNVSLLLLLLLRWRANVKLSSQELMCGCVAAPLMATGLLCLESAGAKSQASSISAYRRRFSCVVTFAKFFFFILVCPPLFLLFSNSRFTARIRLSPSSSPSSARQLCERREWSTQYKRKFFHTYYFSFTSRTSYRRVELSRGGHRTDSATHFARFIMKYG